MAKVKKRALSIALVLAMLLSLSVTAFAAQNDISIELDGKKVAFTLGIWQAVCRCERQNAGPSSRGHGTVWL